MKTAVLKVTSGSNEQRFEVHHTPSRGHQTVQKWYLKADHPVEGARWTTMIHKNIDWYKQKEQTDRAARMSESSLRAPSLRSIGTANTSSNTLSSRHTKGTTNKGKEPSGSLSDNGYGFPGSETSSIAGVGGDSPAFPPPKIVASLGQQKGGEGSPGGSSADDLTESGRPPFEDTFKIQENYVRIQTKLISDYLHALLRPGSPAVDITSTVAQLKDSVGNINSTLEEYLDMVQEREKWWTAKLKTEQQRQDVWEASLKTVVEEGEALERELKSRGSKRRSRVFSSEHEGWRYSTLKTKSGSTPPSRMGTVSPPHLTAGESFTLPPGPASSTEVTSKPKEPIAMTDLAAEPSTTTTPDTSVFLTASETSAVNDPLSAVTMTPFNHSLPPSTTVRRFPLTSNLRTPTLCRGTPEADVIDTDEEDEEIDVFFDAIDAGTLPITVSPALQVLGEKFLELDKAQYSGYLIVRQKLDLDADNRPPTSLWSILKNSIGKGTPCLHFCCFASIRQQTIHVTIDLTRITFPVFFNEPTSMLQRMVCVMVEPTSFDTDVP